MEYRILTAIMFMIILIPCIYSDSENDNFIRLYYGDYEESLFLDYIDIPIVAAISDNSGISGWVRIAKLKTNNSMLIFDSRTDVDQSTIESIMSALKYVEKRTGKTNDFFISYDLNTKSVSGKSTGAAIALGMAALSENKDYDKNFIISGAIDSEGILLDTGGILIKLITVSNSESKNIIISKGQSKTTIYQEYNNKVLAKEIILTEYAESLNINLIQISNIDEAITISLKEKV